MANHTRNELPLIRPTIPPASPEHRAMNTYAPPYVELMASEERVDGPQNADDGDDRDDDPGHGGDEADDDLQQQPRRDGQDDDGDRAAGERRALGLGVFHGPKRTGARGRPTRASRTRWGGCPSRLQLRRRATRRWARRRRGRCAG